VSKTELIEHLPSTLVQVVEAIGIEDTMRVVDAFGGCRVYVPMQLEGKHLLVTTLGRRLADQLVAHFGGEPLEIPRCLVALRAIRDAEIRSAREEGALPRDLARKHGLTERQVYSILAVREQAERPQRRLFS